MKCSPWIMEADDTGQKLQQMAKSWPQLCVLSHLKNNGQAAALWIAFQKTTGERVAMLDGDGQNDPSTLDAMIHPLKVTNADIWSQSCGRSIRTAY